MTDTSQAPAMSASAGNRNWMDPVPADWDAFVALRAAALENRTSRNSLRDWIGSRDLDDATRGIALAAAGDLRGAATLLEGQTDALPRLLCALALEARRRPRAALAIHATLVDDRAVASEARRGCARVHALLRDLEGLEADSGHMQSSGASAADIEWVDGLIDECAGRHVEACAAFEKALATDPHHADAAFALGSLVTRRGDEDAAVSIYEGFLKGELPHHAGALMNLGMAYEDREDNRSAARCFRLVVEADPQSKRARSYLRDAQASSEQYYDEGRERKADKQNAVLRIPVTDFELSVRARNCLQRMNIHTLGDLVCRTESELLSFKNFGETSLQEVKDILAVKGLRLGMMPSDITKDPTASLAALAPNGEVSEIKISELDLSVRSRAALATLGITNVGELMETTETTLLSCKNFGQTSLDEIKSKLRSLNVGLAP
ncbi:MAG: hypothetical protein H6825_15730 [Planctomycetes bacterium]|nr:hypothetical protein [Planctomycetota bacterium]